MDVVLHLCVCKCLLNIWCLYETPIYFSYIYCNIVIVLWGVFQRVHISLATFGLEIHGRKGIHQNRFFIYFGGSKCLDCISVIICCSLGPVLVLDMLFQLFFIKSIALFKLKTVKFFTFRFGQVNLG